MLLKYVITGSNTNVKNINTLQSHLQCILFCIPISRTRKLSLRNTICDTSQYDCTRREGPFIERALHSTTKRRITILHTANKRDFTLLKYPIPLHAQMSQLAFSVVSLTPFLFQYYRKRPDSKAEGSNKRLSSHSYDISKQNVYSLISPVAR